MSALHRDAILERAMTFLLINDSQRLRLTISTLETSMFCEAVNFFFAVEALELLASRSAVDSVLLVNRVSSRMDQDVARHWRLLESSASPSMEFEAVFKQWLPNAKGRFLVASDLALKEIEDPALVVRGRREACDRFELLGIRNLGISIAAATEGAIERMTRIRNLGGKGIIPTGFARVDDAIVGLLPGTTTFIGARPGVGKTSISMQLARGALAQGPVVINSLETFPEMLAIKHAAQKAGINSRRFLTPHRLSEANFQDTVARLRSVSSDEIHFVRTVNLGELEAIVHELSPVLVVTDYLQAPKTPTEYRGNRVEFLDDLAQGLVDLSVNTNTAGLVTSQIGRAGEVKASNANLKGSGGIEECADTILLLERPTDDDDDLESLKRLLTVSKARNGFDLVTDELLFDRSCQSFHPWDANLARRISTNNE